MATVSAKYIKTKLHEYLESDAGKKKIQQYKWDVFNGKAVGDDGMLTKSDMYDYLFEIKELFYEGVTAVIPSFNRSFNEINAESDYIIDGGVHASVSVNESALHRSSLHYMNQKTYENTGSLTISHGEGVDDILALFTHGYSLSRRPYGFWVKSGGKSMVRIGALMHRDPNPFLAVIVNQINEKYRGICEATLDDKYKR